jgi:hypothetical protein
LDDVGESDTLEWEAFGDGALYLVNGFLATLSPSDLKKVQRAADEPCPEQIGGWGCYMSVHVDGFKRFGLLKRFAKFGCDHYDCDKDGLCKTFPTGR